jgi:hypothetical protein
LTGVEYGVTTVSLSVAAGDVGKECEGVEISSRGSSKQLN